MKKYLTLILIIYSSCKEPPAPVSYSGFYISVDTAYKYQELLKFYFNIEFHWIVDTVKPKVLYGIAGIKQELPKDTLKKYYFHRYLFFMNRMNETNGKKSARYEDSANRYYKLLYPKK